MPRPLRNALLVAQSALLAVLVTWPAVRTWDTSAIGSPATDTPKHLWTLWWMEWEVWSGTWGPHTTWANWPDGLALYPIAPLDGLVAALLPIGPVPLSNLLALGHVALVGVCAGWLGIEATRSRLGGHVVGALAQTSAFTGFALESGVGELRASWWIPLGLACLLRAHHTRATRWFVTLGLVLGGAVIACFYHGLFLAMAVAVWALLTLRNIRALLRGYALAAGIALLVVVPVVRGFASTYGGEDPRQSTFSLDALPGASVGVDELVAPRTLATSAQRRYDGGRYLGLVTLGLAALGVAAAPRRARPWVGVVLVALVLSLGPRLTWNGEPVRLLGHVFAMPMRPLNTLLGLVGEPINFPGRFVAPATIALAVLASLATKRWPRLVLLVPLAMADTIANDRVPFPRSTFTLPDTSAFVGRGGWHAVADLTLATSPEPAARNRSIAAQLALGQSFSSVPIERLSAWADSGDRWLRTLPLTQAVARVDGPPTLGDWRADVWLLRQRGFDRVLLTHRTSVDIRAEALLTTLCGEPVRTPNATLWFLPEVTATEAEATEWSEAQEERVAALR